LIFRELVQSIDLHKIFANPDAVVETFGEILSILEEEDVRNYIEKSSDEDCGCEDESTTELEFPMICGLLNYIYIIFAVICILTQNMFELVGMVIINFIYLFNCDY